MTVWGGVLVLLGVAVPCVGSVGWLAWRNGAQRRRQLAADVEQWSVEEHNRRELAKLVRREEQPPIGPLRHAEVRALEDLYRDAVTA